MSALMRNISQADYDTANAERVDNLFNSVLGREIGAVREWLRDHPGERVSDTDDGATMLHLAVETTSGDRQLGVVSAILEVSVELASKSDSRGRTVLHCACGTRAGGEPHPEVVAALLEVNPAAATERDAAGDSPLHLALLAGAPLAVVEAVLARGPEVAGWTTAVGTAASAVGQNVLHCAVQGGRPEVIGLIGQKFPDTVRQVDGEGDTPLHLALWKHECDLVGTLLAACPDAAAFEGWTPLHTAIATKGYAAGTPEEWAAALPPLLEADAAVARDTAGWTPLHLAVATRGPAHVVEGLLRASPAAVAVEDNDLWIPLFLAVQDPECPVDVVTALLSEAPDSAAVQDGDGKFALHYAAENGAAPAVVQRLIQLHSAAASITCDEDADSALPVHLAVRHGKVAPNIGLLLEAHPAGFSAPFVLDEVHTVDNLLLLAVKCKADPAVLAELLRRNPEAAGTANAADGCTALHLAAFHGRDFTPEVARLLIEACPEAATAKSRFEGQIPLHIAAIQNAPAEAAEALIDAFPEGPKERDSQGCTPLYYALQDPDGPEDILAMIERCPEAASGRVGECNTLHIALEMQAGLAVIQKLLCAQPDLISQCKGKVTEMESEDTGEVEQIWGSGLPLHIAAKNAAGPDIVSLLLEAHPDAALCKNDFGQYPLFLALENDASVEVVTLLLAATVPEGGDTDLADLKDFKEWNALHYAAWASTSEEVVRLLVEDEEIASLLGSAPGGQEGSTCLPLHIAVTRTTMSEGMFQLILDAYPDAVLETDGAQYDCLRLAADFGRLRQAQLMIESSETPEELGSVLEGYRSEYGDEIRASVDISKARAALKLKRAEEAAAAHAAAPSPQGQGSAATPRPTAAHPLSVAVSASDVPTPTATVVDEAERGSRGQAAAVTPRTSNEIPCEAQPSPACPSSSEVDAATARPPTSVTGHPISPPLSAAPPEQSHAQQPQPQQPLTVEQRMARLDAVIAGLTAAETALATEQAAVQAAIRQASRDKDTAGLQAAAARLVECQRRVARSTVLRRELEGLEECEVGHLSPHAADEALKRAFAGVRRLAEGVADPQLSATLAQFDIN